MSQLPSTAAYNGVVSLSVDDVFVNDFFEMGKIKYDGNEKMYENQFVVGKSPSGKSFLGIYKDKSIKKIPKHTSNKELGIEPKNKEQGFAINLLNDSDVQLVTLTGIAGSGKTYISLMCALSSLFAKKHQRIVITRSIQPVGRDLGYLPGDINEKMLPWLSPLIDNFRHAFNDISYFDAMRQKGEIEIAPLSYMRGRTFNDSFVIVDEAQNATIHELKTIITRIGKGSKIVLLGDIDQVDTPYIDTFSNGLTVIIEKLKDSHLTGHVRLVNGHRSEVASLAASIL